MKKKISVLLVVVLLLSVIMPVHAEEQQFIKVEALSMEEMLILADMEVDQRSDIAKQLTISTSSSVVTKQRDDVDMLEPKTFTVMTGQYEKSNGNIVESYATVAVSQNYYSLTESDSSQEGIVYAIILYSIDYSEEGLMTVTMEGSQHKVVNNAQTAVSLRMYHDHYYIGYYGENEKTYTQSNPTSGITYTLSVNSRVPRIVPGMILYAESMAGFNNQGALIVACEISYDENIVPPYEPPPGVEI